MTTMIEVPKEDAENYCRILSLLGMEEEGDAVAKVKQLLAREWEWFEFALAVGKEVGCLASIFPDANGHIVRALSARNAPLLESTANMLRGMTMDPAIPLHAKEAMRVRIAELDKAAAMPPNG